MLEHAYTLCMLSFIYASAFCYDRLLLQGKTTDEHPAPQKEFDPAVGLSSELILWRVDPIGPLCKAGGITELAKISSPNNAAFDNVAWLPTLLPR